MNDEEELRFGKSEFRGPPSLTMDLKRWFVQFCALFLKNVLILYRRKLSVLCFLILPSFVVLAFLMEQNGGSDASVHVNRPAIPVVGLGDCNVHYSDSCIRAVYAPSDTRTDAIMASFSASNSLVLGEDVLGFGTTGAAQEYVASNLGTVQYSVFFSNQSLWTTTYLNPAQHNSYPSNMSYVIFYNDTVDDKDPRSDAYSVNFPLLAVQKELETAYLSSFEGRYDGYDLNYGQFWQQQAQLLANSTSNSTSPCDWDSRPDIKNLGGVMPWVIVFSFLFMATISFHLIADERRNKLFGFLRRLGLMDSSYWLSWFIVFQLLLLTACAIAMIGTRTPFAVVSVVIYTCSLISCCSTVAAIVRTRSSALRAVDLNLLFLILYLSGTSFISLSCFLAALSSSASMTTSLYSAQFLVAMVTVAACSAALNHYDSVGYSDGLVNASQCYYVTSSYNAVFSSSLQGYQFVQFVVFFFPWFHAAQAMSDVLSVVQYEGQTISLSDIHDKVTLSYYASSGSEFDCPWIVHSFAMLIVSSVV
jgi:hypothetical protein